MSLQFSLCPLLYLSTSRASDVLLLHPQKQLCGTFLFPFLNQKGGVRNVPVTVRGTFTTEVVA